MSGEKEKANALIEKSSKEARFYIIVHALYLILSAIFDFPEKMEGCVIKLKGLLVKKNARTGKSIMKFQVGSEKYPEIPVSTGSVFI
ncbi:unnamed protein product [Blepharisma stoltei]|uniref:Uncharacterized protein n=1 Tax=Blepharisma stoltei TaxID=1481888 RepID=A0AAU9JI71_9CILI|nr:unnamed protein product [Blepharisma stoltei]